MVFYLKVEIGQTSKKALTCSVNQLKRGKMMLSLKLFPHGLDSKSPNSLENQPNPFIQTTKKNGKVIHHIKNADVALYFLRIFTCSFVNAEVLTKHFSNPQKLSQTILSLNYKERTNVTEQLIPFIRDMFSTSSTWKSGRNYTQRLVQNWESQKEPIQLEKDIGLLMNRWVLNSFLGIYHEAEELSQSAQIFFEHCSTDLSKELIKAIHGMTMKKILFKYIESQVNSPGTLVNQLSGFGWDKEKICWNFQSILCGFNRSGALLITYLLWNLYSDNDKRKMYQDIASRAEEIYQEKQLCKDYFKALKPFTDLLENWIHGFSSADWVAEMPFDATFENNALRKGDSVQWEKAYLQNESSLCPSDFFIDDQNHECHPDKQLHLLLSMFMSMIMSKSTLRPQENNPLFELSLFPKSKFPLDFNWESAGDEKYNKIP